MQDHSTQTKQIFTEIPEVVQSDASEVKSSDWRSSSHLPPDIQMIQPVSQDVLERLFERSIKVSRGLTIEEIEESEIQPEPIVEQEIFEEQITPDIPETELENMSDQQCPIEEFVIEKETVTESLPQGNEAENDESASDQDSNPVVDDEPQDLEKVQTKPKREIHLDPIEINWAKWSVSGGLIDDQKDEQEALAVEAEAAAEAAQKEAEAQQKKEEESQRLRNEISEKMTASPFQDVMTVYSQTHEIKVEETSSDDVEETSSDDVEETRSDDVEETRSGEVEETTDNHHVEEMIMPLPVADEGETEPEESQIITENEASVFSIDQETSIEDVFLEELELDDSDETAFPNVQRTQALGVPVELFEEYPPEQEALDSESEEPEREKEVVTLFSDEVEIETISNNETSNDGDDDSIENTPSIDLDRIWLSEDLVEEGDDVFDNIIISEEKQNNDTIESEWESEEKSLQNSGLDEVTFEEISPSDEMIDDPSFEPLNESESVDDIGLFREVVGTEMVFLGGIDDEATITEPEEPESVSEDLFEPVCETTVSEEIWLSEKIVDDDASGIQWESDETIQIEDAVETEEIAEDSLFIKLDETVESADVVVEPETQIEPEEMVEEPSSKRLSSSFVKINPPMSGKKDTQCNVQSVFFEEEILPEDANESNGLSEDVVTWEEESLTDPADLVSDIDDVDQTVLEKMNVDYEDEKIQKDFRRMAAMDEFFRLSNTEEELPSIFDRDIFTEIESENEAAGENQAQ